MKYKNLTQLEFSFFRENFRDEKKTLDAADNIINKKNKVKLSRGRKVKIKGFKKAIITLKKGQNIDLTTGI